MPPKPKPLTQQRDLIVGQFQRFCEFIASLELDKTNINQLQLRLEKAEQCWDQFNSVQGEIEIASQDSVHAEARKAFESLYFKNVAIARELLARQSSSNPTITVNEQQNNSRPPDASVKLPTVNLPTFSGNYEEWQSFSELFESLINSNANLSDIQKFQYLKLSLKGDAEQTVESLQLTAANYSVAWQLLQNRFCNTRLIVQSHMRSLFEQPKIEREASSSLRRLLDNFLKHARALQALKQPVEHWDTPLLYILTSKLDPVTLRAWESECSSSIPTRNQLEEFLNKRCQMLEALSSNPTSSRGQRGTPRGQMTNKVSYSANHAATTKVTCGICGGQHKIYQCETFKTKSVDERRNEVRQHKLCYNCLRDNHQTRDCKAGGCKVCGGKHNTLLHTDQPTKPEVAATKPNDQQIQSQASGHTSALAAHLAQRTTGHVMLSTAVVLVRAQDGTFKPCRALLDNGSQSNFLTSAFCKSLGLPTETSCTNICGIGETSSSSSHIAETTIRSRLNSYSAALRFVVVPTITQELPQAPIDTSDWVFPPHIVFADPDFNTVKGVEMLIGAEIFFDLMCIGQLRPPAGYPILQKTTLGWIVTGKTVRGEKRSRSTVCHLARDREVDAQLQRFWELDTVYEGKTYTPEEALCEKHYQDNTSRSIDNRFVVRLPVRPGAPVLGESLSIAERRLEHLERKLSRSGHKQAYSNALEEYRSLCHMEPIPVEDRSPAHPTCYLPHHAVFKADSSTTKLRVVFDASAKSKSGVSLNDTLMVGPTVQDDLVSIVLRFRLYQYVISADIEKMYRQVLVHPDDTDLQRIVWRDSPDSPFQQFRLLTVTFGTASAPYLATRCLKQLAIESQERYPDTSATIMHDFYVDDLLTGRNSLEEAQKLQAQLIEVLSEAGFKLRKWKANHQHLLPSDASIMDDHMLELITEDKQTTKSLGILWNPKADTFHYSAQQISVTGVSKRVVLSTLSRIFDPLGLLGPIISRGKIMLQDMWRLQLGWDESLPQQLFSAWQLFASQLSSIEELCIPRRVVYSGHATLSLHGFCDASERAYGACVYVVSTEPGGRTTSELLCSKSRVAPLKSITIPKLELCAAVLLAKLTSFVLTSIAVPVERVHLWSDSTVVLAWVASPSAYWKPFIAHRVAEIQRLTENIEWKHVSGCENPADSVSRGLGPSELAGKTLWWHGPQWLTATRDAPSPNVTLPDIAELPERKTSTTKSLVSSGAHDITSRYSSISKLQRVTAYCLRFVHNARACPADRRVGALSVEETHAAMTRLVGLVQREAFALEFEQLQSGKSPSRSSRIASLSPFIDREGVIRVGGRLNNATIPEEQKHPAVLPTDHPFTRLIVECEHKRLLHASPQLLLASIRQRYWPLCGRRLCRKIVNSCITCFRHRPAVAEQLMGQLPSSRVQPARPFVNTGVDFCGPVKVKFSRRRGTAPTKAYIAVFICMSTKAVHLELVGDLTTDAFLGAFRRFISRRGRPSHVFSDNGTNFKGAARQLQEYHRAFNEMATDAKFQHLLTEERVQWHFIPAHSPHMGGLWEAAVKAARKHLVRILGDASLTFEEFYTCLTQVEACLNSRPLTPLSADPNDLSAITPGHFLVGSALTASLEPDLSCTPFTYTSRWNHLQQLVHGFWKRWSSEYLHGLQQRGKWTTKSSDVVCGRLVLLKEDGVPPTKWVLARIQEVHPGKDGLVRVVTVKTQTGRQTRTIAKVCPLPAGD